MGRLMILTVNCNFRLDFLGNLAKNTQSYMSAGQPRAVSARFVRVFRTWRLMGMASSTTLLLWNSNMR